MQKTSFKAETIEHIAGSFSLHQCFAAPLPQTLIGDHLRLKQILINLVKNAMKFTLKGTIRMIASFDEVSEFLTLHIVDSGKGIKPEEMSKLFTKFGKLQRTAEMNSEGIGMGLMICQNLVQLNEGEITVHSEGEDKGSRFTFTMKMTKPE